MSRLACWSCGRVLYTTVPLESMYPDERRCARCGALLNRERREIDRRQHARRENPPADPGPPSGAGERRLEERREHRRRQLGGTG